MNGKDILANFLINLVAGVVGILIVLWIERQRRPKLTISVGEKYTRSEGDLLDRPAASWLRVLVQNKNVPKWLSWVYQGEPALNCQAWISFRSLDKKPGFLYEMRARWTGTEEPKVEKINVNDKVAERLIGVQHDFDIPPGDHTELDVVYRPKGEDECYGWNNDCYLIWPPIEKRLGKGRFITNIRIKTGGIEYKKDLVIINDGSYEDFRIEEISVENPKA